jgi:hypothetical protein
MKKTLLRKHSRLFCRSARDGEKSFYEGDTRLGEMRMMEESCLEKKNKIIIKLMLSNLPNDIRQNNIWIIVKVIF